MLFITRLGLRSGHFIVESFCMSEIFLEGVRLIMNSVVLMLGYIEFCRVIVCERIGMKIDYEIIFKLWKAVEVWNK